MLKAHIMGVLMQCCEVNGFFQGGREVVLMVVSIVQLRVRCIVHCHGGNLEKEFFNALVRLGLVCMGCLV